MSRWALLAVATVAALSIGLALIRFLDGSIASAAYLFLTGLALLLVAVASFRSKGVTPAERSYEERRRLLVLFVVGWVAFGTGGLAVGANRGGALLVLGMISFLCCLFFAGALVTAWRHEGRSPPDLRAEELPPTIT